MSTSRYLFIARRDIPTILVYNPVTSTQVAEISLLLVFQDTIPRGGTSLLAANDGSILVATETSGEVFRISEPSLENFSVVSLGRFPPVDTQPLITINAIAQENSNNRIYFGGRKELVDSTQLFRINTTTTPAAQGEPFTLYHDVIQIHALEPDATFILAGVEDTPGGFGRLLRFNPAVSTTSELFRGESAVTAIGRLGDSVLFALDRSGEIRRLPDTQVVAVFSDTPVNAIEEGQDGNDSVVFVAADTNVLWTVDSAGALRRLGTPDASYDSIIGVAFVHDPERMYGLAVRANGTGSLLFYYDTTPSRISDIGFRIEDKLRLPGTSDTFGTRLTRGTFTLVITTNERLATAPTVTLVYSDGSIQNVSMTGAGTAWSGNFMIGSERSAGAVTLIFSGRDDAGNVGAETRFAFILVELGDAAVANNRIIPHLGQFATIRYRLVTPQNVTVRIYNMRGQLVADLSPGFRPAGEYSDVVWRALNGAGSTVASGVYLVQIEAGSEFSSTQKIMVIR